MKSTPKKLIIWATSLIGIGVACYGVFILYAFYSLASGCGLDDGPFEAQLIEKVDFNDSVQTFEVGRGKLVLENRKNKLSPTLTLVEEGKVKWTLEMDVSKNRGYETCSLWELSNVSVSNAKDPIRLTFIGHWTYGAEHGSMTIDRDDGDNSYCLSW